MEIKIIFILTSKNDLQSQCKTATNNYKVSARQTETDGRQQLLQDKDREAISP